MKSVFCRRWPCLGRSAKTQASRAYGMGHRLQQEASTSLRSARVPLGVARERQRLFPSPLEGEG